MLCQCGCSASRSIAAQRNGHTGRCSSRGIWHTPRCSVNAVAVMVNGSTHWFPGEGHSAGSDLLSCAGRGSKGRWRCRHGKRMVLPTIGVDVHRTSAINAGSHLPVVDGSRCQATCCYTGRCPNQGIWRTARYGSNAIAIVVDSGGNSVPLQSKASRMTSRITRWRDFRKGKRQSCDECIAALPGIFPAIVRQIISPWRGREASRLGLPCYIDGTLSVEGEVRCFVQIIPSEKGSSGEGAQVTVQSGNEYIVGSVVNSVYRSWRRREIARQGASCHVDVTPGIKGERGNVLTITPTKEGRSGEGAQVAAQPGNERIIRAIVRRIIRPRGGRKVSRIGIPSYIDIALIVEGECGYLIVEMRCQNYFRQG
jgi:hypothetical protein